MRRVCLFFLTMMLVWSLVSCGFSYGDGDLSRYILLDAPSLDDIVIQLDKEYQVTDAVVEDAIHDLLLDVKTAVNAGEQEYDTPVGDGDVVGIHYTVVLPSGEIHSDGFDVGCDPYPVEVGAGMFPIQEVETALMGIVPREHKILNAGVVESDSIIYIEGYSDGVAYPLFRLDMGEADTLFGAGFATGLVGATLGGEYITITTQEGKEYHMLPRYISRGEVEITGTYPEKYGDTQVTVYVQTAYMVDYDVPPMTDETVTQILNLHKDSATPLDDLHKQVREELELAEGRQAAIRRAILSMVEESVTYLALPKGKVKDVYGGMKKELEAVFEYSQENLYDYCVETYGTPSMESLDGFARAMYGDTEGKTAKEILTAEAEAQVRHDLLIYAMAKAYGIKPTEDELTLETQKIIASYLEGTETTERQLLRMWGGREYFEAQYYDAYVFIELSRMVTILYHAN